MSTIELRKSISEKIAVITDKNLLNKIDHLLNSGKQEELYRFNSMQIDNIKISLDQIKKGETIPNNILESELEQWLNLK